MLELVFVLLLEEPCTNRLGGAGLNRDDPDGVGAALHLPVRAYEGIGAVQLDWCFSGKVM